MAVAVKKLLREGWKPKGTLIFSGMADEEALGTWGAEWLVTNKWDDVKADEVVKRIAAYKPKLHLDGAWREFVDAMQFEEPLASGLLNEAAFQQTLAQMPVGLARVFDAS